MFHRLIKLLKEGLDKLFKRTDIKETLGTDIAISDKMITAQALWADMYTNSPPWKCKTVTPLRIPAAISKKIAKLVTLEANITCTGSDRADFISEQLNPIRRKLRNTTGKASAIGGIMFKPYIDGKRITTDTIMGTDFAPTAYDSNGDITGAAFFAQKTDGEDFYTRIEKHELIGNTYTIKNMAFKSKSAEQLGKPCSLSLVKEWSDLVEKLEIENVDRPLFAYFKMPFDNTIDLQSPLGVSIFAEAVDTIKDLDEQYGQMIWEFRGGELAVHLSEDMMKHDLDGEVIMPEREERLFRLLENDAEDKNFYKVYAPAFRDESLRRGFNDILRNIEWQCQLAFGTFSDVNQVAKTATETIHSKQDSYSTVSDIQQALEDALKHLIYAIDVWTTLGKLAPAGKIETSFYWDDSIVVDKEQRKAQYWEYVMAGKFPAWRYYMEFEGYTEDEAKEIQSEMSHSLGDPYADS